MSLKKKLTVMKMGAASMVKKALILEKLFQLLSQKKCDALLHISDREEETGEEISEEKTEEDVKMNEREGSQKAAAEAVSDEEPQTDLHFQQNDKLTHLSVSIMQDPTVKGLTDAISIIERLAECNNLLFKESVPGFEKTVIEETDVDDIIEVSDTEEKDNLTIVSMKRMSTSFKCKVLSLIALKPSKCIQISEQSISTSVKADSEVKTSCLTPAKVVHKVKM
ncbi:hypothetical protein BDDG_09636, partial [Blastomyces dermatitidis ATCC 18188]